ncbi:formyltransferase family protein [Salinibacter ruber]|uniref:Methionyl-tRNA formyltransferase n=1 Tax=Salinibacter ruber TaxID=146919 RepID=A0A9X2V5D8_9BACT|nr:formyltransferase family protein [Salinibacter ruber]MCS4121619.1 methionyl-tRNA formyltransferase [Salinibacter ruber]
MRKKVVFMGAKEIGSRCLRALLKAVKADAVEIVGVLTRPTKLDQGLSVGELCDEYDLPRLESLKEYLALSNVDIVISVQHDQILKKPHLEKPTDVAINLHMAPLPEYRGCNQFTFAILDEANRFGTTIHVMEKSIDAGDILFERRFQIPDDCWVEELYDRTVQESADLFAETLPDLLQGDYTRTSQEELVAERGTNYHYRDEIEEVKQIELSWDAERIQRHIRATDMPGFESPYTIISGQKVHFER